MKKKNYMLHSVSSIANSVFQKQELAAVLRFIAHSDLSLPLIEKMNIVGKLHVISDAIDCPHTQAEMLAFITTILSLPEEIEGCIVEAGCYKGGSTAKFSLAARRANRELVVFDSFQGIPAHVEPHAYNIYGKPVSFVQGEYCGTLEEVKTNITAYGDLPVCHFVEGWFEDTLPQFKRPIASVYIDVDLVASVKSCLTYLYPLLVDGGSLYCQDGHLPLVIQALADECFWQNEVGYSKPQIEGLGQSKLIRIIKTER